MAFSNSKSAGISQSSDYKIGTNFLQNSIVNPSYRLTEMLLLLAKSFLKKTPFFTENMCFFSIVSHTYNDFVKKWNAPFDYINMPIVTGSKEPGKTASFSYH